MIMTKMMIKSSKINQRTTQEKQEQFKSSRIKKNSRPKEESLESRFKVQDLKNQDQDSRLKIQE